MSATKEKIPSPTLKVTPGTELLKGELYFARLATPLTEINTKEGVKKITPQYKLSLALSDTSAKKAAELGLYVSEPTDTIPKKFVTMKRMVKDNDAEKSRPRVIDENGYEHDLKKLIGNGSRGSVLFRVFGEQTQDSPYKAAAILAVQVDELVEYVAPEKKESSSKKQSQTGTSAATTQGRKPVNYGKKAPEPVSDDADLDDEVPF